MKKNENPYSPPDHIRSTPLDATETAKHSRVRGYRWIVDSSVGVLLIYVFSLLEPEYLPRQASRVFITYIVPISPVVVIAIFLFFAVVGMRSKVESILSSVIITLAICVYYISVALHGVYGQ